MWSYAFRRVLATVPTLLLVITACYALLHLTPGGPFDLEHQVSGAVLANLQAKYHLDEPVWQQYLHYLWSLLHGDLGASFRYVDWSVNDLVATALPVSLAIGGTAIVLALSLGTSLGTWAALRQNSLVDYAVMALASMGGVFPSFVIGPVLILVFSIWLNLLPSGGWDDFSWRYMVLPVALLTFLETAKIARVTRASMLEVLHSHFIRTAHAKGLPLRTIVLRHAMRPALLPVVSLLGPMAISTITSAVVTESVFLLPSLGKLIVNGASNRDYTLVLGLVVLVTVLSVLFNLLVDLTYAFLDPKIRY